MRTVRKRYTKAVAVTSCPSCGNEHSFDFQLVMDEVTDVAFMMTSWVETSSCTVTCPKTGKDFVVDVPVTLWSGQTLVSVG